MMAYTFCTGLSDNVILKGFQNIVFSAVGVCEHEGWWGSFVWGEGQGEKRVLY